MQGLLSNPFGKQDTHATDFPPKQFKTMLDRMLENIVATAT